MKIRTSFVSNSSSSSFILDADKYSKGKIVEYITKLLDAAKTIGDLQDNICLEDICKSHILDDNSKKDLLISMYRWDHDFLDKEKISKSQLNSYSNELNLPKRILYIESTEDNSIPWSIQEALQNIGIRRHWG